MNLVIPIPPSTNNLFMTVKIKGAMRRIKTNEYRAWIERAAWQVHSQVGSGTIQSPVEVTLTITGGKGFNRQRDLDNLLKPVLDLLVASRVIQGDNVNHVVKVSAHYLPGNGDSARCDVSIERSTERVPELFA